MAFLAKGSYTPGQITYVASNQPLGPGLTPANDPFLPATDGYYEPQMSLNSYLETNVLAQLLDPLTGPYSTPSQAAAALTTAAQGYKQASGNGGPNNATGGGVNPYVNIEDVVNGLVSTYQQTAVAQGATFATTPPPAVPQEAYGDFGGSAQPLRTIAGSSGAGYLPVTRGSRSAAPTTAPTAGHQIAALNMINAPQQLQGNNPASGLTAREQGIALLQFLFGS